MRETSDAPRPASSAKRECAPAYSESPVDLPSVQRHDTQAVISTFGPGDEHHVAAAGAKRRDFGKRIERGYAFGEGLDGSTEAQFFGALNRLLTRTVGVSEGFGDVSTGHRQNRGRNEQSTIK